MRYMLLIYKDEKLWGETCEQEIGAAALQELDELKEELQKRGVFQAGDPLESPSSATTVRLKNGKPLMTDGPFAETKEQLGGYIIVEAKDLDEAIAIATRNPVLRAAFSIEVRPIRERPPR